MNKNSFFTAATMAALAIFAASCAKEQTLRPDDITPDVVKNLNAIAKVSSPEAISELLTGSDGNLTRGDAESCVDFEDDFVSMMDVAEVVDNVPVTYYDLNEFEELVPNTNLASLLNSKGEIQVGDTMYRITKAGTYFFDPSLRSKVDATIDELDQTAGTDIGDWTVNVAYGIMRRNTFEESKETVVVDEPDSYTSDLSYPTGYGGSIDQAKVEAGLTRGYTGSDNNPKYPLYFVDAHTVVGEFIEGIFGRNKTYEIESANGNRRLKGKLYYYDYKFYSEMGALGKWQKKQLIGWNTTPSEMMGVVWKDVMVELDIPMGPSATAGAPVYKAPTCLGTYVGKVSGSVNAGTVLVLGGIDTSKKEFQNAVMGGAGAINRYLNLSGSWVPKGNFHAIVFLEGPKVTTLFVGDGIKKTNVESIRKVFSSDFGFEIKLPSDPKDALAWLKNISGISSGGKLKTAKCMIETQNGGEKVGVFLVKRFD